MIQIKRTSENSRLTDGVQLRYTVFIRAFLKKRGLTKKDYHPITGLTVRILERELTEEIERLQEEQNIEACLELQQNLTKISDFVKTLKRGDELVLCHARSITF